MNNSIVIPNTCTTAESKNIKDLTPTVAANLNTLLETQNISAKKLYEMTGYSESAISKYRAGTQFPPIDFFYQLKTLFGISFDDFLFKEITRGDIHAQMPLSAVEQAEKLLCDKFCGTISCTTLTQVITRAETRTPRKNLYSTEHSLFPKTKPILMIQPTAVSQFSDSNLVP